MTLKRVEIIKKLLLEELVARLRNVRLKGFSDVKIYETADFTIESFNPKKVTSRIFIPQPTIYKSILDRIEEMRNLFLEENIDIFRLDGAVDYLAFDEDKKETLWTLLPPVVERLSIPIRQYGSFDYNSIIGEELRQKLSDANLDLNPDLTNLSYKESTVIPKIDEICDGSHRVHLAVLNNLTQNLLLIDSIKEGYPYYAVPQPYNNVHIEVKRDESSKGDKIHVLNEPAHKFLYRLFPSGGIHSGDVRTKAV